MFVYRAKEPPFLCFSMILNLSYFIRTGVVLFIDQLQWSLSVETPVFLLNTTLPRWWNVSRCYFLWIRLHSVALRPPRHASQHRLGPALTQNDRRRAIGAFCY